MQIHHSDTHVIVKVDIPIEECQLTRLRVHRFSWNQAGKEVLVLGVPEGVDRSTVRPACYSNVTTQGSSERRLALGILTLRRIGGYRISTANCRLDASVMNACNFCSWKHD